MSKKPATLISADVRWIGKRESASRRNQEDEKDEAYNKRLQIAARVKQTKLKPKMVFKAKLADDLREFKYAVQKIDRQTGEVFLKNERGTMRKVSVFDKLFGPGAKTRTR